MGERVEVTVKLTVAMARAVAAVVNERLAADTEAWMSATGCDALTANRELTSAGAALKRIEKALAPEAPVHD